MLVPGLWIWCDTLYFSCHQHIRSVSSVTNIQVAKLVSTQKYLDSIYCKLYSGKVHKKFDHTKMIKIVMIRDQSRSWFIVSCNGELSNQKVNSLTRHSTALIIDFSKKCSKNIFWDKIFEISHPQIWNFWNEKNEFRKIANLTKLAIKMISWFSAGFENSLEVYLGSSQQSE